MPIAFPEPDPPPAQAPEPVVRRPDERDRTRPRTGARDDNTAEPPEPGTRGELVHFPGAELVPQTRPLIPIPASVKAWVTEARDTVGQALDGAVYSGRRPSIRDSHARLQRAEWAGNADLLKWAGRIYGYPMLLVRVLLMAVDWLIDHPSRLIVLGALIGAAIALH